MVRTCLALPTLPAGSVTEATTSHVPAATPVVTFHEPSGCTSVVIVCPAIDTVTVVPGAASELPAIVGTTLFVVAAAPPAIATNGETVSIVSCWLALPTLDRESVAEGTSVGGGVDLGGSGIIKK
jgi:hypothetical protein